MSMDGLKHYLSKRGSWFFILSSRGLLNWMPDEPYLKLLFKYSMGYPLNLAHPKTFNEKLQWLKLHDRKPLYTKLVDKYEVKAYVAEKIGAEYVIPTIAGPWDSVDEIDFDALPDQFVLKCTHDSGGVVICRDKAAFDRKAAKAKLAKSLSRNFYWAYREWPYKDVKPRVFAERYLGNGEHSLNDYKVMCFHGEAKLIQVHMGRFEYHTQDFYDTGWNLLDIYQGMPLSGIVLEKPDFHDEMLHLSEQLAESFLHLRVDWLYADGQLYFGELTFYDGSGLMAFDPISYDELLGSWLCLPADGRRESERA